MAKDFTNWHTLKTKLEAHYFSPDFSEQEIWWCSIGQNIGSEEDGKNFHFERPVIIFRKFNDKMFWGLPLTSKRKKGRFFCSFVFQGKQRTVILSQLRVLSPKRLLRRIGRLSEVQFKEIEKVFRRI